MPPNHTNSNALQKRIIFRFYAELNDFLPLEQKQKPFPAYFKTPVTVGEAIDSFGIPGSEVDLVLVNSEPAGTGQRLFEDDYVSVYPAFEAFDIHELKGRKTPPLRNT